MDKDGKICTFLDQEDLQELPLPSNGRGWSSEQSSRLATAIACSRTETTKEGGNYDIPITLEMHKICALVLWTGLPVVVKIRIKLCDNHALRIDAAYEVTTPFLAGALASLTIIENGRHVLVGTALHNSILTTHLASKEAVRVIMTSKLFFATLIKHFKAMYADGCVTLRFIKKEQNESLNKAVLVNCNIFQRKLIAFQHDLRAVYGEILGTAAVTNPILRNQLDPMHDAVYGHIMLHPSRRLFQASNSEHALFQMAYDCYVQDSGLYRGVFLDPRANQTYPGTYDVSSGPSTVGCHYENLW